MEIPVLIESIPGHGYRVSGAELSSITAEGATAEEALSKFKQSVSAKIENGARIAAVEIRESEHPWLKYAGMFDPNDTIVQEWLQIIQEQRDREGEATE
jgi:hypothetical protein